MSKSPNAYNNQNKMIEQFLERQSARQKGSPYREQRNYQVKETENVALQKAINFLLEHQPSEDSFKGLDDGRPTSPSIGRNPWQNFFNHPDLAKAILDSKDEFISAAQANPQLANSLRGHIGMTMQALGTSAPELVRPELATYFMNEAKRKFQISTVRSVPALKPSELDVRTVANIEGTEKQFLNEFRKACLLEDNREDLNPDPLKIKNDTFMLGTTLDIFKPGLKESIDDQMRWIQGRHENIHARYEATVKSGSDLQGDTQLAKPQSTEANLFHKDGGLNLSYLYADNPTNQYSTNECFAHAFAGEAGRSRLVNGSYTAPEQFSPTGTYLMARATEVTMNPENQTAEMLRLAAKKVEDKGIQTKYLNSVMGTFSKYGLPKSEDKLFDSGPGTRVTGYSQVNFGNGIPTVDKLKEALKSGPFSLDIDSDAKRFIEDWIRYEKVDGLYTHYIQVVGYGQDVDPYDSKPKEFFWVRDSICANKQKCMTYKVSAEELALLSNEALRVTATQKRP